jgi:uncharacterized phage-associated protein
MPYSASVIAYAFVKKAIEEGSPLTQMKLQKMVYFAQGIHLILHDEPLIKENFQAWKYGPVVPAIYHDYKFYGSSPINDTELVEFDPKDNELINFGMDINAQESVNETWKILKDSNAIQLSNWTHNEDSPWHKHFVNGVNDIDIPNVDIKNYFSRFLVIKNAAEAKT